MIASVTQVGVDDPHIVMGEVRSAKAIDTVTMVFVDLLVTSIAVEVLALVGFTREPFEQLGDHILLSVAVGEDEVGIDPVMRVSDELQMSIQNGVGGKLLPVARQY